MSEEDIDVLQAIVDDAAAEVASDTVATESAEAVVAEVGGEGTEKTETEPEPDKWSVDRLATEKEWTPEKLQAAAKFIRTENGRIARAFTKASREAKQANGRKKAADEELERYKTHQEQWAQDRQALRTGTDEERMASLKRLTGEEPGEFLERMALHAAGRGELAPNQKNEEYEKRIKELDDRLKAREQHEQEAAKAAEIHDQISTHYQTMLTSPDEETTKAWPLVCARGAPTEGQPDRPRAAAAELVELHQKMANEFGSRLTVADFLDKIERKLRIASAGSSESAERDSAATAKPGVRAKAHQTVSRDIERNSSGGQRELTEAEWNERIAKQLGL